MGSFSSKPKARGPSKPVPPRGEISEIDRAVLDLKNARDRLQRYRKKLEQDDVKLLAQAKKARDAGRKEQAIGILRLRKFKQVQASSCESQLLTVLQMVETIDSKQNESQVLSALAAGKDTLKKMHEETTVDDVLELMDSIAEEIEVEREITQILEGVPQLSPADEEAVEAELEALEAEMAAASHNDALPSLPAAPDNMPILPVAPTTDPKTQEAVNQETKSTTQSTTNQTRVAVPG